jgi:hypothetical protein
LFFSWYADLILRIKELESWTSDFSLPPSVWLSGFFNPQSFLTAIMQVRKMTSHAFFTYTHFLIWSQIISFYQNVVLQSQFVLDFTLYVFLVHYIWSQIIFFFTKLFFFNPQSFMIESCRYEKIISHALFYLYSGWLRYRITDNLLNLFVVLTTGV